LIGRRWFHLGVALTLATPIVVRAQERALQSELLTPEATRSVGDTSSWPKKFHLGTNEFNLGFTTLIIGGGYLQDYASYNQDSASASEFDLERQGKIRDSRFILSGRFRTKRPIPWTAGIMYDWSSKKWLIRQTMVNIAAPEIWGQIHIGRMKEGISLYKIMSGYDGMTMERFTFSDVIPLFGDGVKWLGYVPKYHVLWNLGGFTNAVSENETWQTYRSQVVGRAVYVRLDSDTAGKVMHIGAAVHVGKPQNDTLRLKSKPEVFEAPNFLDTGLFPATRGTIAGLESYYRKGSFLAGGEYYGEWVKSEQSNNPFFNGGTAIASWLITGEVRPYTTPAGIFQSITPRRPVTKGGKGAFETVIAVSYSNYDADSLSGGKFWRVTPMVNWYLDDHLRLEFEYGFGSLNRFGTVSRTEFFQARMQFQFSKIGDGGD
jgi:phosphate-selective porin OprO and OprP